MKQEHKFIDKILPYGELLRGFANQPYISKADLKHLLRNRGVFFNQTEKEYLVPCLSTLLLSPVEFDELRECQNTKEDNIKKNTSRLEWNSNASLADSIRTLDFKDLIPEEGVNFWFNSEPTITIQDDNPNKVKIEFNIERNDLNKSWYESSNVFSGKIELEKSSENEIRIVKSYTSSESNAVGDNLQKKLVNHFKENNCVGEDKQLIKILFGDFENEDRIVFFNRLSAYMNKSEQFEFIDIINMEFRPDNSKPLPNEIDWMNNKSEMKFKGRQIHDTFFIKDKQFHKNLQFWEMESSFKFNYLNYQGNCNVVFSFKDFLTKGDKAEFEITISNFNINNAPEQSIREKTGIKNRLLDLFEERKDETYKNFINYLHQKTKSTSDVPVDTVK